MTTRRFQDLDLSALPPPPAIEDLDYEAILAARIAEFRQRWAAVRAINPDLPDYDVSMLETDPAIIVEQADSYHEMLLRGRVNDAVRAVMLATSWGGNLDALGARVGAARLVDETDAAFRRRIQLAYEALSTAGPYGAYVWQALSAHPGIKDAAAYGPEEDFAAPGEAWVTLLSNGGNGSPSMQMLTAVADRLGAWEIRAGGAPINVWNAANVQAQRARPLTDKVIVHAAEIIPYQIEATIVVPPGPDVNVIYQTALERLRSAALSRHRIGGVMPVSLINSALHAACSQSTSLVDTVHLASPLADVGGQPRSAPYCTGIDVSMELAT
ncbi:MAG: baseplate J/gp47 family protein [Mesorhizobium sp.]|nr:baseplate J/gp47 family protein [Mesorhizobium sp.]